MNSETLFSMALGLQPPWQVKEVTFSTDELARSELHLHIDFVSGSRFLDDTNNLSVERQWQHLSFFCAHLLPALCGAAHYHDRW